MSATAKRWAGPMALYLLGIFMGALDTGIITPARPLISTQLGVDESAGNLDDHDLHTRLRGGDPHHGQAR
ncbi:hypothetical protein [Propioniciclava flava]